MKAGTAGIWSIMASRRHCSGRCPARGKVVEHCHVLVLDGCQPLEASALVEPFEHRHLPLGENGP
jgi:hypothetical protein